MPYASVSTMRPPATPSDSIRTSILPMRKRASWAVSTGSSARSRTRGGATVAPISSHSLNPTRARGSGFERVGKVLGLAGHLAIQELHDAHRIGPAAPCHRTLTAHANPITNALAKGNMDRPTFPRQAAQPTFATLLRRRSEVTPLRLQ